MCQPITSYPELIIVTTDNIPLNEKFDANISAGSFGVPPSRIFELCKFTTCIHLGHAIFIKGRVLKKDFWGEVGGGGGG